MAISQPPLTVVTWNLFHGRAVPPAGRSLRDEFAEALAGWAWDVALLQEVPPWWPALLAERCAAQQRRALTSRNLLLPVQRELAERWPDTLKSSGGGANAILVRGAIAAHRRRRLRWWPERRVVHAVALADGTWMANLHATVYHGARAAGDAERAASAVLEWAGDAPVVLGGDFNVRRPEPPGFEAVGGAGVDHVFARGLRAVGPPRVLDRGHLSDHAPVAVALEPAPKRDRP